MVRNLRAHQVAVMLAKLVEEGLRLEREDKILLDAYVRGIISNVDMLAHARQFFTMESYCAWMLGRGTLNDQAILTLSVEQVLGEFQGCLRRRSVESAL